MSIHPIHPELQESLAWLEEADDEAKEIQARTEFMRVAQEVERDAQLSSLAAHIKNLESYHQAVANAMVDLRAKAALCHESIERAKRFTRMVLGEGNKWTDGVHKLSWRKSQSVEIIDEALVPDAYWRVKEVRTIDKLQIGEDFKVARGREDGEQFVVPGVFVDEKQNLQIK